MNSKGSVTGRKNDARANDERDQGSSLSARGEV